MTRFSIRDVLWLTVVAAVAVAWWIDRDQLAGPAADYHRLKPDYDRLKSEEEAIPQRYRQVIDMIRARAKLERALQTTPLATPAAPVEKRRPVPGDDDYRFPPEYPLHYGPSRSP